MYFFLLNTLSLTLSSWWGPKVLVWLLLVVVTFFIPNGFFIFWGDYVALIGATIFILLGLVLLVDFAHSWSETCLDNWEKSESTLWQWILIGSTAVMYITTITLTGVLYGYFASSGCTLNRFFISFNLALCIISTITSIHPTVQASNSRSGLAQAGMVAAYCTYLTTSAVTNHAHNSCNPFTRSSATGTTAVVLGAIFTFLAIAYSTSRAATQSRALVGGGKKGGAIHLPIDDEAQSEMNVVSTQPGRTDSPRYQALLAAVQAGYTSSSLYLQTSFDSEHCRAIPESALYEGEEEEEEEYGATKDDERSGTRYNACPFVLVWLHY